MPTPLLYETHMHTPLCKHAVGLPGEYAAVAERRNLKGIIVTCHNPMPDGYASSVRMHEAEFPQYVAMVEAARQEWAGRVDVRIGLEADFSPGFEAYLEKQIASHPFNYVLGSIHPQMREYREKYFPGDAVGYQRVYFDHIACAAESGLFDTMSHPDLIKNMDPAAWQRERVWGDILRALDRIAKTGVAMELNTSGKNRSLGEQEGEFNPGPEVLRAIAERGIPMVLGADAHVPERVADQFPLALTLLEEAGFSEVNYFLDRQRHSVPIAAARASLIIS